MGSSTNLVADYYCVSHIPAATIPNSRLSDILARMHQGRPLTKYSLDFLQQQNLPGLYRLACGEITHEIYIAGLDPAYLSRHQAAKAANQAKETERQALAANYPVRKTVPKMDREARRKQEREATEAVLKAQRARQVEWKAQRERNSELAAAAYQTRAATPDYTEPTARDLARYFHLEHIAAAVSSPMRDVLEALFRGRPLTGDELTSLRHSVPDELYRLAFGQLTLDAYISAAKVAETEAFARKAREEAANAARIAREEAAEAARIARENDPEYLAMMQTQALYRKYGVSLTDKSLMPRMTNLIQQIDAGNRLPKEEFAWLSTEAREHLTERLRKAYHRLEADFHADQYRRTQHPRNALSASGHYRKCDQSDTALELIDSVTPNRLKLPEVRSAMLTTRGGALRDLGRRSEAIQMGETAHALMPQDYRPCTLLGAVHMELHNFEKGHDWYEKARKRGAPEHGIDSELRSIFLQLDSAGREAMKRFLLAEDSRRYPWLNEPKYQKAKNRLVQGNH